MNILNILEKLVTVLFMCFLLVAGFIVGTMNTEARYQKVAVADGCGGYDSKTLEFYRQRVIDGAMLERVLVDEINTTKALKGGKK